MEEDKRTMHEIKDYLATVLNHRYGYCSVAIGENELMLKSGNANLAITIEVKQ